MKLGDRVKQLRINMHLSGVDLAKKAKISSAYLAEIEKGKKIPSTEVLQSLARALGSTSSFLLGETEQEDLRVGSTTVKSVYDLVNIPVLDKSFMACAGNGNHFAEACTTASRFYSVPRDMVGIMGEKSPFIIQVEGNSMEGANIREGSMILVNPNAEVLNGDPALVCFGLHNNLAIKWVYYSKDNSVEIRSANADYPPFTFSLEDIENGWFRIIGKVMMTIGVPSKGI
jgi:phage repressor protein C with HTH and peptisase S24 domain